MTNPRRQQLKWLIITLAVSFVMPFAVVRLASECAGMALCMMLFLVINPLYSILLGIISGRDLRNRWNLPLISSVAFLAGTWLYFDIHEPWFIAYATIYLILGITAMLITHRLLKNNPG